MNDDNFDDLKIILWLILFLFFGIIIISCSRAPGNEQIITVNGPVSPSTMGITLQHEHILVDFAGADSIQFSKWDRGEVVSKALPLLLAVKEKGLKTFIECTPEYLGRDPLLLKELSEKTGLNFITNTGFYGAVNNRYIPDFFYDMTPEAVAELWINEFENGIDNTGVKPGFIKIAVERADSLSHIHRKLITAAGLTHLRTGLVIASHTGPDYPAFEQIKILGELGIDPSAFIWVHAQSGTIEGNKKAGKAGAWISLDKVANRPDLKPDDPNSIGWYADRIIKLKEEGLLENILLSQDSGWYDPAKPGGGQFNGYTDIFDFLIPELKSRGFTDSEIDQLLVKNPAKAFVIKVRLTPAK